MVHGGCLRLQYIVEVFIRCLALDTECQELNFDTAYESSTLSPADAAAAERGDRIAENESFHMLRTAPA